MERGIRHAEVRELVGRNVAALTKAPAGRTGRPSKSLTLGEAVTLAGPLAEITAYLTGRANRLTTADGEAAPILPPGSERTQ